MSKLKLADISKSYTTGTEHIEVLKGVSLEFRENEFISILGPSGCGKTTLLNIIGGLDHYDNGDLIITTKNFKDADWDAYRNESIGFVFQNYNLISHQTVLQNVEISMTLSGVSPAERKQRAKDALAAVGLADHIDKRPNQMSGGQMQRVAIARALVNDPDTILADEPTGALDTKTSVQVMEILKEISKTKLVIMVTHNPELADEYSNRIIRVLDGEVQSDSNPLINDKTNQENSPKIEKLTRTSMSMMTAMSLSFRNLLTKKGRTLITAFAGSIGIIGVALVLALSNGLSSYMSSMQSDTLSGFPISISTAEQSLEGVGMEQEEASNLEQFTDDNILFRYDSSANRSTHTNVITEDFLDYIAEMQNELSDAINTISYTRGVQMNVLAKGGDTVVRFEEDDSSSSMDAMDAMFDADEASSTFLQELPDDNNFILSLYDLIGEGSRMPESKNEVVLVVDKYNRINTSFFEMLGMTSGTEEYQLTDFIEKTVFNVIPNNDYYTQDGDLFTAASPSDYEALFEGDSGVGLTVVGVLRIKEDAGTSYLSEGIAYTTDLTDYVVESAKNSDIAMAQQHSDDNVLTGLPFTNDVERKQLLLTLGADTTPTGINIYPVDFESKDLIKAHLDAFNEGLDQEDQIIYSDMAETITAMTGTMIDTVSYVLIGFAAISLVVSSIMIGIITYVSVLERTKEIGILRSVGARKKDISRVFNAETLIVGFTAGILGVGLTYLLTIPINMIIANLAGIEGIANLSPTNAITLVLGSMLLTLIGGFLPARMAAKKDPVVALRTE